MRTSSCHFSLRARPRLMFTRSVRFRSSASCWVTVMYTFFSLVLSVYVVIKCWKPAWIMLSGNMFLCKQKYRSQICIVLLTSVDPHHLSFTAIKVCTYNVSKTAPTIKFLLQCYFTLRMDRNWFPWWIRIAYFEWVLLFVWLCIDSKKRKFYFWPNLHIKSQTRIGRNSICCFSAATCQKIFR